MIIQYKFINQENGMTMEANVPNVLECVYSGETVRFVFLGPKGEKIELEKKLSELLYFCCSFVR